MSLATPIRTGQGNYSTISIAGSSDARTGSGKRKGDTMPFIEWDDSLSVCVAEIDQQHKHEAELLNKLHDAEGEDAKKAFKELAEHTATHFATEEKYFDQFGYEDSAAHKAAHKDFLETAGKLGKKLEEQGSLPEEDLELVRSWLVDHIKSMDQKYTKCFNDNGLS
jgi:hemerythrin-like metal-binding protein